MLFSSQNQVQQISSNAILAKTSVSAVVWNKKIHLFYTEAYTSPGRETHGISQTTSTDGEVWTPPQSIGIEPSMSVMPGTSPSAVFWRERGQLYVFYTSQGKNEINYTTTDGTAWSAVQSVAMSIKRQFPEAPAMKVMDGTCPSAVCWNGRLYLFYTGVENEGVRYTTSIDGVTWSATQSVARIVEQQFLGSTVSAIEEGTSPNAVCWNSQLYLFYTGQDSGIQYTRSTDGQRWEEVHSIPAPGLSVQSKRNASAIVFMKNLYVFYTSSREDGIWYTTTRDGLNWSDVKPVDRTSGLLRKSAGTSPWVIEYDELLFVFWYGVGMTEQGLWIYQMITEVNAYFYLDDRNEPHWSWARSNSVQPASSKTLQLNELGTQEEFVFNLDPSTRGVLTAVDLILNGNGRQGPTQTARISSGARTLLTLLLPSDGNSGPTASVDVTVGGYDGTLSLTLSDGNRIGNDYYVSVRLNVLADGVKYISPDPQIILKPTSPPPGTPR